MRQVFSASEDAKAGSDSSRLGMRAVGVDTPPDAGASLPCWQSPPRRAEAGTRP